VKDAGEGTPETWQQWLSELRKLHGDSFEFGPLTEWQRVDPTREATELFEQYPILVKRN
jgi:hypothetical protein